MRPRSLKFLLNSKSSLLRKFYFFYNIYLRNFKYLNGGSQFNEDIYLSSFFEKDYIGKFVDLGCFHPTRDNNTFRFYKKKWRGINVDLNPITIELFNFFRSKDININSTKSMTGHLLGAAGAIEAIASILAMEHSLVPPTINHTTVDENIDSSLNLTLNKAQKREVNVAMSNTFGFGGHNACVLFKKYSE